MATRTNAAEMERRIDAILRVRLDGAQFHDILQYASEQGWKVSERTLWDYIRRADERLVECQKEDQGALLARHLAQRQSLYARAVNAADYRTALAILADESRLRGMYPETKLALKVKGESQLVIKRVVVTTATAELGPAAEGNDGPPAPDARGVL